MESGVAMTPTAAKKGAKLYRYYTSMDLIKNRATSAPTGPQRLAAGMVEGVVVGEMRRMLRTPEVAARAIEALREAGVEPDERAVVAALAGFDDLWASLFPAEQGRIVQLVVQRVTVSGEGISVDLRNHGVGSVVREMLTPPGGQ
ncbi:MAG: site-specific recombinase [Methylocystaceae bacterium]|nr:site-specific recombinase [Methylocystaceae bacterium]